MRYKRIALALLVALAPILGVVAVNPASAQTSDYSKTFTEVGDVRYVGFDTEGWSADTVRVIVETNDGPGETHVVLYNESVTTTELQEGSTLAMFENAGAYDQLTVTVKNADSEPTFGTGADWSAKTISVSDQLASTGGDRDLTPDLVERLNMAVNPGLNIVDVTRDFTTVNESDLSNLDANETKLEIYQSAASSGDTAQNVHAIMNNHLQDAETVALIKGKNAYIRELNEGGSKTASKSAATENITEYYSRQEMNMISQWNSQVSTIQYLRNLAQNDTEVSGKFVNLYWTTDKNPDDYKSSITGFGTSTYTLQNGTTVDVLTVEAKTEPDQNSNTGTSYWTIGPATGTVHNTTHEKTTRWDNGNDLEGIEVKAPTSNYEAIHPLMFEDYKGSLNTINTQTESAVGQMDTVVNQTYDQYQAGDINSSDLVDPYVLQNQFSPGSDFQSWSAATLALLGTNQPTDFDNIGYMNVTLDDGTQLQGVLHAPHNPPSGEFDNTTTYYPSNFTGPIYVTTDSQVREVTQPFTIDEIQTADGRQVRNITYVEKNYTTTSADDIRKLNNQLAELRAEIEARESNLFGGGALFGSGSSGTVILLVLAGAVVALMMREDDGNGGNSNGGGRRSRRRY